MYKMCTQQWSNVLSLPGMQAITRAIELIIINSMHVPRPSTIRDSMQATHSTVLEYRHASPQRQPTVCLPFDHRL